MKNSGRQDRGEMKDTSARGKANYDRVCHRRRRDAALAPRLRFLLASLLASLLRAGPAARDASGPRARGSVAATCEVAVAERRPPVLVLHARSAGRRNAWTGQLPLGHGDRAFCGAGRLTGHRVPLALVFFRICTDLFCSALPHRRSWFGERWQADQTDPEKS